MCVICSERKDVTDMLMNATDKLATFRVDSMLTIDCLLGGGFPCTAKLEYIACLSNNILCGHAHCSPSEIVSATQLRASSEEATAYLSRPSPDRLHSDFSEIGATLGRMAQVGSGIP